MHDIVRDYVIHQHSPEELRLLQRSVVDAVLGARPEPEGFPTSEFAAPSTFEGYCARQLFWHIRGSLEADEEPPDTWLSHQDSSVRANVVMAVGLEALVALLEAHEAAGELVKAAQASWTARFAKGLAMATSRDFMFRASDLLGKLYIFVDCAAFWIVRCALLVFMI